VDTFPEVNRHPAVTTDLRFKLNKTRSKVTSPHEDLESLKLIARGSVQGASRPNSQGERFPDNDIDRRRLSLHPLSCLLTRSSTSSSISHGVKLPKTVKHDTNSLKAGNCSFHGSQGHVTVHCWPLKRHFEDLTQCDIWMNSSSTRSPPKDGDLPIITARSQPRQVFTLMAT